MAEKPKPKNHQEQPSPRPERAAKKQTGRRKIRKSKAAEQDKVKIREKRAIARAHGITGFILYLSATQKLALDSFLLDKGWQTSLPRNEADAIARGATDVGTSPPALVLKNEGQLVVTNDTDKERQLTDMSAQKTPEKTDDSVTQPVEIGTDLFGEKIYE
jgi:hypothetical protein